MSSATCQFLSSPWYFLPSLDKKNKKLLTLIGCLYFIWVYLSYNPNTPKWILLPVLSLLKIMCSSQNAFGGKILRSVMFWRKANTTFQQYKLIPSVRCLFQPVLLHKGQDDMPSLMKQWILNYTSDYISEFCDHKINVLWSNRNASNIRAKAVVYIGRNNKNVQADQQKHLVKTTLAEKGLKANVYIHAHTDM